MFATTTWCGIPIQWDDPSDQYRLVVYGLYNGKSRKWARRRSKKANVFLLKKDGDA